jgi:catechol 2,3-dioxygenase-like lactoylglutathione lyase family enzyme
MKRSSQPVNSRVIRIAICVFLLMTFTRRGVLAQQSTSSIQVSRVGPPSLVVSNMDRAVAFYSQVLSFEKVSDAEVSGDDYEHLEGLFGIRMRVVRLQLGNESIEFQVAALFGAGFTSQNENLRPTVLLVWIVRFGDEKFHQPSGKGNGLRTIRAANGFVGCPRHIICHWRFLFVEWSEGLGPAEIHR